MTQVATLSQLNESQPQKFTISGQDVMVVRIGQEVFAIDDTCSHGAISLSEGDVVGTTVECCLHGSAFDLRTGRALTPPAVAPVEVFEVTLGDEADPAVYVTVK